MQMSYRDTLKTPASMIIAAFLFREFAKYLENDYNQTKAVMSDPGLAK